MNTGVYLIKNKVNNKFYVGSSAKSIKERFWQHRTFLRMNKHGNIHLQRSWNKHGENSFDFIPLEYCSSGICIEREQYYIDTLLPEFNISPTAGNRLGCKQDNSKSQANRTKALRDRITPEIKKQMQDRAKELGNKNKNRVHTEVNKEKCRNAAPKISVIGTNLDTNEEIIFKSSREARRVTGMSMPGIKYSCLNPNITPRNGKNRKNKWKFRYVILR